MKKLMTLLVYLVLLILLFIFIKNNYNDFTSIPKISFRYLPLMIFLSFLLLTLATLFLIFFPPEFRRRNNKILDWIINIINGWKLLSKDSRLLYKLSVYELFFVLIMGTRLFFAYRSFDLSVPIFIIFIISIFSTISTLISITPAGLGVTEFIITLSSTFLGLTVAEGLQVALLDRLASVIISFSFGLIYSYILMNN